MQSLRQDLLLGVRSLRKEPASAIITSLTLALGIGLCTISFSLLYGVFFRGLGVPEANRLAIVSRINPSRQSGPMGVTVHDFYDWSAQQTSFEGLTHYSSGTVNLAGAEGPERYDGAFVSANLFDQLRIQPALGSTFRPDDDKAGAALTVVLGYEVWTNRYNSDPAIAGKSAIVNGEAATILGVMPKDFKFPENQVLWVADRDSRAANPDRAHSPSFNVFGRLKPGVSLDQAEREMALIAQRLATQYPTANEGITTQFSTFVEASTNPQLLAVFSAMQVATLFVLLIAIANVANLLMARATLRTRESAVRAALGASRLRVVLPFFAETLVLSFAGTAIGMGIAWYGIHTFDLATQGVGRPYFMVFALDFPVLLFVAAVTLVTALLASAAPAFYVLKTDLNVTLKDEVRGSSGVLGGKFTRVLVTAEIALSCALLVGAGLMVRSIVKLKNFKYPFATENIFTARVGLFDAEYPTPEARGTFFRTLEERLRIMPGAGLVTVTTNLPVTSATPDIAIAGEVYPRGQYPAAQMETVSPGFFPTFGTTLLQGRNFTDNDNATAAPVAIVNQAFVDKYFPKREALGQRFAERAGRDSLGPWKTVIGVVPNLRMEGFDPSDRREWGYYVPMAQRDVRFANVAVRAARGDAMALTAGVREVVRGLNPNLPIYNVDSMDGVIRSASWFYSVFGTLFIVFGAAALFMATVGLYGVLSFSVSRRMKEMGIRMALGANSNDVTRLVLSQGGRQIGIGLFLGLAAAFGLTQVIGSLMFEITPRDPQVYTLVVVVILAVGVVASLIPARRATRAQPTTALRAE